MTTYQCFLQNFEELKKLLIERGNAIKGATVCKTEKRRVFDMSYDMFACLLRPIDAKDCSSRWVACRFEVFTSFLGHVWKYICQLLLSFEGKIAILKSF